MNPNGVLALLAFTLLGTTAANAAGFPKCETLLQENSIPHTEIVAAEQITTGRFVPPHATDSGLSDLPAFCRVIAIARPSADSEIHIEVWMPLSDWNGRALGTGNGGFAGNISYSALANGLRSRYAVANTDMGMAVPPGATAAIFVNRPERWRDWGYRATHEMALVEASLVRRYYSRAPAHSYFSGCSTGGEQALMEAQRFPSDYDGILAGAPANNRTGVHLSILWNYISTHRETGAYLPPDKLELLHNRVLAACDRQDGLEDGLLANPVACQFNPATLLCHAGQTASCLSASQLETVRRIYAGPSNPATRQAIYPGVPKGSELDWTRFGSDPIPPFAPIFQWVSGLNWDWHTFDFSTGPRQMEKLLAKDLNATNGNLTPFEKRGGKLIAYHGLGDWLVVPGEALRYRTAVLHETKAKADTFYRLYLIPGMGHCGGGTGPNSLKALDPLVDWVEKGVAPTQLLAIRTPAPPTGPVQRPICPYPQIAKYQGTGDPNNPSNFTCADR